MILEEVIENINSYVSGSWVFEHEKDDLLEMLIELKERRESELRPANKFLGIGIGKQFSHFLSEIKEIRNAFHNWHQSERFNNNFIINNKYKDDLAKEIIDTQMSGETLLAELGYNEEQRRELRKEIIEKNRIRGYYNTMR